MIISMHTYQYFLHVITNVVSKSSGERNLFCKVLQTFFSLFASDYREPVNCCNNHNIMRLALQPLKFKYYNPLFLVIT